MEGKGVKTEEGEECPFYVTIVYVCPDMFMAQVRAKKGPLLKR